MSKPQKKKESTPQDIAHESVELESLLFSACEQGNLKDAKRLLQDASKGVSRPINIEWCNPQVLNLPNALHAACSGGFTSIAELLLAHGADIESTDQNGTTALMYAAHSGHVKTLRMLAEKRSSLIDTQNNCGESALSTATLQLKPSAVRYLVSVGASLSIGPPTGGTCLHYAAAKGGGSACMQALLEHPLSSDLVNLRNEGGCTALMLAAQFGGLMQAHALIRLGADIDAVREDNWTALNLAVWYGHVEMVKLLLRHNADFSIRDVTRKKRNALDIAKEKRNSAIFALISEKMGVPRMTANGSQNVDDSALIGSGSLTSFIETGNSQKRANTDADPNTLPLKRKRGRPPTKNRPFFQNDFPCSVIAPSASMTIQKDLAESGSVSSVLLAPDTLLENLTNKESESGSANDKRVHSRASSSSSSSSSFMRSSGCDERISTATAVTSDNSAAVRESELGKVDGRFSFREHILPVSVGRSRDASLTADGQIPSRLLTTHKPTSNCVGDSSTFHKESVPDSATRSGANSRFPASAFPSRHRDDSDQTRESVVVVKSTDPIRSENLNGKSAVSCSRLPLSQRSGIGFVGGEEAPAALEILDGGNRVSMGDTDSRSAARSTSPSMGHQVLPTSVEEGLRLELSRALHEKKALQDELNIQSSAHRGREEALLNELVGLREQLRQKRERDLVELPADLSCSSASSVRVEIRELAVCGGKIGAESDTTLRCGDCRSKTILLQRTRDELRRILVPLDDELSRM